MAKTSRPTLRLVDRFVLLVAWLVTCGLVYVFGFYVGKGTQERHVGMEERIVRLPVNSEPPPEGLRPKETKEFPTFYRTLPAGEKPAEAAKAPAPATPPRPPALVEAPSPPVAARPAPAPVGVMVPSTTLVRATTSTTTSLRTAVTTTTTPLSVPPPTLARPVVPVPHGPSWTVEASPTRSRAEAEQMLAALKRRGYDAVLVQVQRDGDTWYRLRVGRYASPEQASEVMRRLRESEGVTHAFVASE